jgi:CBS domain-containing protein
VEYAPAMTTVRDVMATELVTVRPTDTVAEAATVMGRSHVGSALVMDGERLAGIFTERDILRALSQDFDAPGHPIADWMTREPLCVQPDMDVQVALELMLSKGFRHLPVEDAGSMLGIVSMRDLSGAIREP